jgi:hypothetical protein
MTPTMEQRVAVLHGNILWALKEGLRVSAWAPLQREANPGGPMWSDGPSIDWRLAGVKKRHAVAPSDLQA